MEFLPPSDDAPNGQLILDEAETTVIQALCTQLGTNVRALLNTTLWLAGRNCKQPLRMILAAAGHDRSEAWKVGRFHHRTYIRIQRMLAETEDENEETE